MNRIRKLLALVLALLMLLSFAACGDKEEAEETVDTSSGDEALDESDVVLPYSREDGVNPYTAESLMNECLMPLLYEGLYSVGADYQPNAVLATDIGYTDGNLLVRIDTDHVFSDGSKLDAEDVVYSFELAKDSAYYSGILEGFSKAKVYSNDSVLFTTGSLNMYGAALLTFPIVKDGTAGKSGSIPTGSGRYVYEETTRGGTLTRNKEYDSGKYTAEQIYLSNMTSSTSLLYTMGIGGVDATFDDLSGGSIQRVTASLAQVPLNNLVLIGVRQSGGFATAEVRKYVSDLLDRTELISSGMDGYADPTNLPLNPSWYVLGDAETKDSDKDKAKEAVAEAFEDQTVTIVTSKDNDFKKKTANALKTQLLQMGIDCEVKALEDSAYKSAVNTKSYDICIAEYKITNDMDISERLSGDLKSTFQKMQTGDKDIDDFVKEFDEEYPFIVIGFRNGVLAYSRSNTAVVEVLPDNPYANVYEWSSRQE